MCRQVAGRNDDIACVDQSQQTVDVVVDINAIYLMDVYTKPTSDFSNLRINFAVLQVDEFKLSILEYWFELLQADTLFLAVDARFDFSKQVHK